MVTIKRVYNDYDKTDGQRILVDRLWPRGLTKEKAHVDVWLKEISPSTELREWFDHDLAKWEEFEKRYTKELVSNSALEELRDLLATPSTLVYGAKDELHNNAVVIQKIIGN